MLMEKYNDLSHFGKLTSQKDLLVVTGMESLFSSIERELTHYLGSHAYLDASYGSHLIDYTGYIPEVAEALIRLECERIISKDERVVSTQVTTDNFLNDHTLNIKVTTVNGLDYEYEMEIE